MDPLRLYVLAAAIVIGWWSLAWGHDWYPSECCDERDCRPLEPHEVEAVPGGFSVLGRFVSFGEAEQIRRRSPDGRFHGCFYTTYAAEGGYVHSDILRYIDGLPCLWAPEAGI